MNNYINYILGFFRNSNCKVGQGVMFRTIRYSMDKNIARPMHDIIWFLINTLVENDYLAIKNGDFILLTQKGSDAVWGDEPIDLIYNLNETLRIQIKDKNYLFDVLWKLIGPDKDAIIYVKGPDFYNIIKPYLPTILHGSYTDYMDELRKQEKSTSRINWYRNLFLLLNDEDLASFFRDLSFLLNKNIPVQNPKIEEMSTLNNNEAIQILVPTTESTNNNIPTSFSELDVSHPKALISYAWEDDDAFMDWILKLARDLRERGIDAQLDRYQPHGTDLVNFMLNGISTSDKVLCILTPKYKQKAESGKGGAAYEGGIISHEIYDNQDTTKFIPILRKGEFEQSSPSFIKGRKGFVLTNEEQYEKELPDLVKAIKGEPIVEVPLIKS